jgi:transcriptional regulator with XRE-family HTH domain
MNAGTQTDSHRLGQALRQARLRAGLTQAALGRRVGYSRSTIANAESGDLRAAEFYRRCDAALGTRGLLTRRAGPAPRAADLLPPEDLEPPWGVKLEWAADPPPWLTEPGSAAVPPRGGERAGEPVLPRPA